ncbi:MAG TPA: cytochrome c oxidase subunit 3 family protein [Vicinamibacterales bacterium]|nr:cytochrome c oxidase subunit 3 family protein [Vicinamibacterales bacterium]
MSEGYAQPPTAGLPGNVAIHGPGDPHDGHSHPHHPKLQHHFDDMAQQAEASTLGMWVFLVTEIMFFGGLFMAYLMYRWANPDGFQEASAHLSIWLGGFNTAVLIFSSLTMAMAVRAAQTSAPPKTQVGWLLGTIALGLVFLVVKYFEYAEKFSHNLVPGPNFVWEGQYANAAEIFYSIYFCMTGLHALHMIIGIGIMAVITWMAWRRQFDATYYTPVEVSGLYWHFVDIVWIFLFPLLYLIGRHYGAH